MQNKSAGSENLIGVGGSTKGGAAKIWGQLVPGLLSNFKNRILGGLVVVYYNGALYICTRLKTSEWVHSSQHMHQLYTSCVVPMQDVRAET